MCATSNWGNLPTAVVLSVTQVAPFNPATDPDLGVSFVSIFIVAYFLGFWVSGAAHSLSWDYLPNVPQGQDAESKVSWSEKPFGSWFYRKILRRPIINTVSNESPDESNIEKNGIGERPKSLSNSDNQLESQSQISNIYLSQGTQTISQPVNTQTVVSGSNEVLSIPYENLPLPLYRRLPQLPIFRQLHRILSILATPITVSLIISIPIALVQPLKALFVDTTAQGGPDWKGPDGRPPLFFIIDTASFVGGLAVPLGLILLGASFARLKLPRPLSRLPLTAMIAVTIGKMVVLPVFGVFVVQAMQIRENKAERFVAIFLAGTPAAVKALAAIAIALL
ncbi:hypothetical protein Clacol_005508 [Clathrus columnatus]|uniref:PIN-like protein n=1 Tax=Clathrus columnatus TaxID=1419009 RepID=A0AAV5AE70_9AGAM|nr:hypothetical protein Clacol_005508 [Clathrus columnatus]